MPDDSLTRDLETLAAWRYYDTVPGAQAHAVGMRLKAEIKRLEDKVVELEMQVRRAERKERD